jgi:hypothetical protein
MLGLSVMDCLYVIPIVEGNGAIPPQMWILMHISNLQESVFPIGYLHIHREIVTFGRVK